MAKIVTIEGRHKPSVAEICDKAKEDLVDAIVIGYDEAGDVHAWSTDMEARDEAYLAGIVNTYIAGSCYHRWNKNGLSEQLDE